MREREEKDEREERDENDAQCDSPSSSSPFHCHSFLFLLLLRVSEASNNLLLEEIMNEESWMRSD